MARLTPSCGVPKRLAQAEAARLRKATGDSYRIVYQHTPGCSGYVIAKRNKKGKYRVIGRRRVGVVRFRRKRRR